MKTGVYEFAKSHDPNITTRSFVQRRPYGDYLGALLNDTSKSAVQGCELRSFTGEVMDVIHNANGKGVRLIIKIGDQFDAGNVVLSIGSFMQT